MVAVEDARRWVVEWAGAGVVHVPPGEWRVSGGSRESGEECE